MISLLTIRKIARAGLIWSTFPLLMLVLLGCSSKTNTNLINEIEQEKPNILFIYTDDQAPWALGRSGNPQAITPNMDALADAGMLLPNSYTTTPVCSPSRAGLLTSKYGYELGIDDWINTHYQPAAMSGLEPELGLLPSENTWPEILKENGYETALIGKWHLGVQPQHHPRNHGYDKFVGFTKGGTKTIDPTIEIDGQAVKYKGLTVDILTDEAIRFVSQKRQSPFLLSLHYRAPHTRWLPVAEEDAAPYLNMEMILPDPAYPGLNVKKNKRFMKEYLSSVRSIDRNLGRLLSVLNKQGLLENTLIVFTSDHGYNMGHNGIWHKGNGHWLLKQKVFSELVNIPADQRPNMYDNSIKVPAIAVWQGRIQAGSQNLTTLSNLDWFPTLLEAAGVDFDKGKTRGTSQLKALLDPSYLGSTDYYASYTTKHQSITGMRMYSDGHYKLVKDFINPERDEFYDLRKDAKESQNLIKSNIAEIRTQILKFSRIIARRMEETQDPLLQKAVVEN